MQKQMNGFFGNWVATPWDGFFGNWVCTFGFAHTQVFGEELFKRLGATENK